MRFKKQDLIYSLPAILSLIIFQGCATPKDQLLGAEEQVKLRSMQRNIIMQNSIFPGNVKS